MNRQAKNKIRAAMALKKIEEPVILDSSLLRSQINTLSSIINITNDDISELLVGATQVLEIFEWLPRGEYTIQFKIK